MGKKDLRNAMVCAMAVAAAFLLVNPFVQMPFDDDWLYAFTTRELLRTGRVLDSGWNAPLIITHVYWGALFVKIFGYSFVVLRFSTLPLAAGCAGLAYLLARQCGVSRARSIFLALLLCLSPMFLPLAASFMTDVPAMFYTLFCLCALVQSRQSTQTGRSLAWLSAGVVIGIVGGMARQSTWLVPLCVVPYLCILRPRNRPFVIAAAVGWIMLVCDIAISLIWFHRQQWVHFNLANLSNLRAGLAHPEISFGYLIMFCFTVAMIALPAAPAFIWGSITRLWRIRKTWPAAASAMLFCVLAFAMSREPTFGLPPWLPNIVSIHGVMGGQELSGHRPVSFPLAARGFVSILVLATCFLMLARGIESMVEMRTTAARLRTFFAQGSPLAVLMLFGSAYFALMIVRSAQNMVFDRYCLPLIPCIAIPLLLRFKPGPASWALLTIYILYAVLTTQDNLALAQARLTATERLQAAGVPAGNIAAGSEFDAYTEVEQAGGFEDMFNQRPARQYRIEFGPDADTTRSEFGVVDYRSWLPPWHRRIFIDQLRTPHRLKAASSVTNAPPSSYEAFYDW